MKSWMMMVLCGVIFAAAVVPDDSGVPPAPDCESDFDCPYGNCVNGQCVEDTGCPYECCDDWDCEGITEVCENYECIEIMEAECEGKICKEDEFLNSECECVPLGGGVIDPCCGVVFALLAVVGFAIRKG